MKKIMIVDDSLILRSTIRTVLERAGFTIAAEAGNAEETLTMFDKSHPDLVLLDILLPGESGLDILRQIKAKNKDVKVLIVTAVNQDTVNEEAKKLGADNILYKPFDPAELTTAINSVMK